MFQWSNMGPAKNCLSNIYEPEKLTSLTKSQLKETDLKKRKEKKQTCTLSNFSIL